MRDDEAVVLIDPNPMQPLEWTGEDGEEEEKEGKD